MSPWEGSSRSGLGLIGGSEVRLTQEGDAVHEDTEDYDNAGGSDGDDDDDDDENDDDGSETKGSVSCWAPSVIFEIATLKLSSEFVFKNIVVLNLYLHSYLYLIM